MHLPIDIQKLSSKIYTTSTSNVTCDSVIGEVFVDDELNWVEKVFVTIYNQPVGHYEVAVDVVLDYLQTSDSSDKHYTDKFHYCEFVCEHSILKYFETSLYKFHTQIDSLFCDFVDVALNYYFV